ncbi:MAG: sigma-54-dependent transcriptional regulator [Oligoflexia bacterium]|jgi:DNA-binding NtrC family response regulator
MKSNSSPDQHRNRGQIVVVDDDQEMRSLLQDSLEADGYQVTAYSSATEALARLFSSGSGSGFDGGLAALDLIISDIKMPQMDGIEFTRRLKAQLPEVPVILVTAFGSIETALEAMRKGAFHYIVKPFKLAEISVSVQKALEHRRLTRDNSALKSELKRSWGQGDVIGKSAAMKQVFDLVDRVAPATANVLITGESGTGKEMVARSIHARGPRAKKPFVAINCTAIPETLLESELFGHAKGSFTGAIARKKGLFEEAEGGTLFLDEIGDMNVALQAKLLRVIQERKVRSVGDTVARPVDVRIISATHKDLKQAIQDGHFREDLYYRLSVIPIVIPPLRHRSEDIPLLAEFFLRKAAAANGSKVSGFSPKAMTRLLTARWDGNVRELENVIERAVVLAPGHWVDESDLPEPGKLGPEEFYAQATQDFPTLDELERRYIRLVLDKTGGKKEQAAQILGINRRTLYRKERGESDELSDADQEA